MNAVDDLLAYLFEGKQPAFYAEFGAWVRESRRFKAFVVAHRGKIRTKLKNARDEGGMNDLRAELRAAALLLREARFTLEYERYAAAKQRGPDFTVMFKTHTPFNVEVRRIRMVELDDENAAARATKLLAVLCDKVKQMPPGIINVLWLNAERALAEGDVASAAATLRGLAERKDEAFFARRGFDSAADFLKHLQRLSGIALHQTDGLRLWLNPLARHKLPPDILNALQRLNVS